MGLEWNGEVGMLWCSPEESVSIGFNITNPKRQHLHEVTHTSYSTAKAFLPLLLVQKSYVDRSTKLVN